MQKLKILLQMSLVMLVGLKKPIVRVGRMAGQYAKPRSADYETKDSYSIRVRSADVGGLWVEKAFTIRVTNVNEAPTDIGLSPSSVAENQAVGTTVGTLSAADPDGSLLLRKATNRTPHGGGTRFAVGSASHRILAAWIAAVSSVLPLPVAP